MKFATIGHLLIENDLQFIPKQWIHDKIICSPELKMERTSGYITGINLTAAQVMSLPKETVRKKILEAAVYLQDNFDVELIQLGALTTSVTDGGKWITDEQNEYSGFVNHGDSYTAAVACQAVNKALSFFKRDASQSTLAVVGAYGIIGEAVSKILVPKFEHSFLIGRREEKLIELQNKLKGDYECSTTLKTNDADIIVTATSHPTALLKSEDIKGNSVIVDVSQPINLSNDVCEKRPDIHRIDGGYIDFPVNHPIPLPGMPIGKNFACIAEVIVQAIEEERQNHVGSIDLDYLKRTEKLGKKYGYTLNELTNFGEPLEK
jgi:fatty aldehyde-generating acyl-ACP reductase